MPQLRLFDATRRPSVPVETCDPMVPIVAKPRLSRQCAAILLRLRRGPATNQELADIALKYSGRTSDLRKAGYNVVCYQKDHKTGLTHYRLEES